MKTSKFVLGFLLILFAKVSSTSGAIADRIVRKTVAGIDVVVYPMNVNNIVTIAGNLPAGDAYAQDGNIAAATLTGLLLDKGTIRRDKFAIARQLDDAGASLGFSVDEQTVGIGGKTLTKDLSLLIQLLAEELREPAFSGDEFAKAKKQFEARVRTWDESTGYRAQESFLNTVFPVGHPNHVFKVQEWIDANQQLTVKEVEEFHKRYYGPAQLTLVFVGDVEPRMVHKQVANAFKGWKGGVAVERASKVPIARSLGERKIEIKDKTSISVLLAQATGLRSQDADTLPLGIGTAILGSGLTSRLMSSVRDREGLTYGISAGLGRDTFVDGTFAITATFAPALLQKGISATRRELERWYQGGVTAEELADRKTSLVGSYQVGLATTDGMADAILATIDRGRPLSWLDESPKAVSAVTLEQVNAAIKKYLDPNRMMLVQAGTFETSGSPVTKLTDSTSAPPAAAH